MTYFGFWTTDCCWRNFSISSNTWSPFFGTPWSGQFTIWIFWWFVGSATDWKKINRHNFMNLAWLYRDKIGTTTILLLPHEVIIRWAYFILVKSLDEYHFTAVWIMMPTFGSLQTLLSPCLIHIIWKYLKLVNFARLGRSMCVRYLPSNKALFRFFFDNS